MNHLSNWILSILSLVFLAPVLNAAHQDLRARFVLTVGQINSGLAEPAFNTFQVVVSFLLALAMIGCYLAVRNEKYQSAISCLVTGIVPVVMTHILLLMIT